MDDVESPEPSVSNKCREVMVKAFTWKNLKPVFYGQGLSLLLCGTAVTSTYLTEDYNANIPFFQTFLNYFLLATVYGVLLAIKKTENGDNMLGQILRRHWWQYFLVATVDVAANGMIITAYQYTTLTSVQVLDCFVIFVVMFLSYIVLKVRYLWLHYLAVAISLVGVAAMVLADWLLREETNAASNPLLGDMLVIGASVCYGISNVTMEYFVKERRDSFYEIPAMYGLFGSFGSGILVLILERDAIQETDWTMVSVSLVFGFVMCMFLLYTFMPRVMFISSATTVNISILTADLYALFVGLVLFSYQFSPLYIVSFFVIGFSLVLYNSKPPPTRQQNESTESAVDDSDESALSQIPPNQNSSTELTSRDEGTNF